MYNCKILADSISPLGQRLTTFEVTIPRIVLAEFNTHRMFSRNSASSRAIPVAKAIKMVEEDPFIPETFGKNQKGMVAGEGLAEDQATLARHYWQGALDTALDYAAGLERLEVHKGLANRLLEPFKWHTIIVTATDWSNFFALRTDSYAQEEIRRPAIMMKEAYESNVPCLVKEGEWAVPLVTEGELYDGADGIDWTFWRWVSVGRCARVSTLTHDGRRDPAADVELAKRLMANGHMSPFEHVATPFDSSQQAIIEQISRYIDEENLDISAFGHRIRDRLWYEGNLRGWHSMRMDVPHEDDYGRISA